MPSHGLTVWEGGFQNVVRGARHLQERPVLMGGYGGRRLNKPRRTQIQEKRVHDGLDLCGGGRGEPWSSARDSNRLLEPRTTKLVRVEFLQEMDPVHLAQLTLQ